MIDENNRDFSRLQILRGQHLMVTEIPYVGWHLVRHYPPLPLHVQGLLLFLVVVCACVALALTLSYYLVERLYHPVKELLEASVLPIKSGKQLDEFQIIRTNMEKITELGARLLETMA